MAAEASAPPAEASERPAISVRGVGKRYQLYDHPVHRVMDLLTTGTARRFRPFWALQEVSFDIMPGQTVGIVGRNGSGKSTLLEIIADTLKPTTGEVVVNGRISALLELGAGFNPEFTGRENVLMNATIMGISQSVIEEKMDDIIAFANIGDHINHPVKTYSSGMYVRLAFATSIHMDPDILIVDEALAVGDIGFQRKCFREFEKIKASGKTILFVTHATDLIQNYCDSALFLHEGKIRKQGDPKQVIYDYLDMLFGSEDKPGGSVGMTSSVEPPSTPDTLPASPGGEDVGQPSDRGQRELNRDPTIDGARQRRSYNVSEYRWGDQRAQIIDYLVETDEAVDPLIVEQGGNMSVLVQIAFHENLSGLIYGLTIKTLDGIMVYSMNSRERKLDVCHRTAGEQARIRFEFDLDLIPGTYFVSLGVALDNEDIDSQAVDRRYDMFSFSVHSERQDFGIAQLNGEVREE